MKITNLNQALVGGLVLWLLLGFCSLHAAEVNVYSARKEALIKPMLDRFTELTGTEVNLVTGKADALIKRLELEGVNSPADLLLTVDVGRLHRATQLELFSSIESDLLASVIPARYRDPQGYWYGLSLRSRVIVYSLEDVKPGQLSSYEALADAEWKGRVCVRSSSNIYNQSLVSAMLAHNGEEKTESWAKGLVANFARPPKGGDRDQIKAVAVGQCALAVVNSYYLAGMINSKISAESGAAAKVGLFWPNQQGRGAHVNISGAGVTRSSKNRQEAIKLLEFLAGEEAQAWYAEHNHEFPVRAGVPVSETLRQWGQFKADQLELSKLGIHNASAVRLMDRAGWQ